MEIRTGLMPRTIVRQYPARPKAVQSYAPTEHADPILSSFDVVTVWTTTFYRLDEFGGDPVPVSTHVGEREPRIVKKGIEAVLIDGPLRDACIAHLDHDLNRACAPSDAVVTDTRDESTMLTTRRVKWFEVTL